MAKYSDCQREKLVTRTEIDWEEMWAPYDEPIYTAVLNEIGTDDIVLDIGAGDLRLARRMAKYAERVYAIERNKELVADPKPDLPSNCQVTAADARLIPFPEDISVSVLLMRHCTSFAQYWAKLAATRCKKLITNARWGLGIEIIDLTEERFSIENIAIGWYACCCGGTGFLPGETELINEQVLNRIWEVDACPAC